MCAATNLAVANSLFKTVVYTHVTYSSGGTDKKNYYIPTKRANY